MGSEALEKELLEIVLKAIEDHLNNGDIEKALYALKKARNLLEQ
jgi:hypothetical protein